jgi:hypothetical protein
MRNFENKPPSDRPAAGPSRGSGRRPPRLVSADTPEKPLPSGLHPRSLRAPPPRDPSGIARSSSSRLANASGRDTASVHAVLPFGIHASPSLVVPCDDELRPCARTCAPWTPPAPCRSSAAVSVAGSLNPPSMARSLMHVVEPASVGSMLQSRSPANPSEPSRRQLRIRANQGARC